MGVIFYVFIVFIKQVINNNKLMIIIITFGVFY